MKPFSLEEYLKNPNRKVVTRDGRPVRIICTDRKGSDQPVIALISLSEISNREVVRSFTTDGYYFQEPGASQDLFFAPEKQEGWVNIYADIENNSYVGRSIYQSKEEAENFGKTCNNYIRTLKIEWEE